MEFVELKSSLSQAKKIYLLEGEEAFFRARGEEMIKNKFLVEPDFNLTNIDGTALKGNLEQLLSILPVCPFLGDYRVVVIREWYPLSGDFKNKELSSFFNSDLTSTIVIINNGAKSELLKKQSAVTLVDCKKADLRLITAFLQSQTKKENVAISKKCCEMIAEFCLFDMNKINAEIAKLISYSAGSGEITEDDVENLVQKETDYKIYEVVGFIADKNYDKAYSVLKEMIDDGNGQVLLVSLYYHFRRLLHISLSDKSDAETAELLGVKEFAVKKSRMQARAFSPKRLMRINNKLIEYDEKFKSGEIALNQALLNAVFMILTEE